MSYSTTATVESILDDRNGWERDRQRTDAAHRRAVDRTEAEAIRRVDRANKKDTKPRRTPNADESYGH